MTVATGSELRTLGRLASESGVDYFRLRDAAKGVRPALVLNDTAYFSAEDCRRLVETARAKAAGGKAKAPAGAKGGAA